MLSNNNQIKLMMKMIILMDNVIELLHSKEEFFYKGDGCFGYSIGLKNKYDNLYLVIEEMFSILETQLSEMDYSEITSDNNLLDFLNKYKRRRQNIEEDKEDKHA